MWDVEVFKTVRQIEGMENFSGSCGCNYGAMLDRELRVITVFVFALVSYA